VMQSHKDVHNIRSLKVFLESGSDRNLNRVADFFPALVYFYDVENRKILSSNEKFHQWLGLSAEVLEKEYGNDLLNVVHPDDRQLVKNELSKYNFLKDNDSLTYTARFKTRDNDWKFFRTEGMVFSRNDKGNASSFIFIGQDVSNELKGSEELQASRNLIRETEKLLQFGSWRWDPNTDILEWSEGMYALLEYDVKPESFSLTAFAEHIFENLK
jgi:PAS domain S-box-containing protein